jgi:chorismate synthase
MSHNTFGKNLRFTSFGESHGSTIGCVLDGFPPGMPITTDEIKHELRRRATGRSKHTSQRREQDDVQIVSGVFEGKTTGHPIGLIIENTDAKSKDYSNIATQIRPGHGDYSYWKKYGLRDYRGGGRSSARETTMRVAAGALAKKWLKKQHNIEITAWLSQIGDIHLAAGDLSQINNSPFFTGEIDRVPELEDFMHNLRKSGDSVGACISAKAVNVPAGWGEPVYGKLDAELALAMMSINATKGVDIGAGFESVAQSGSVHRDEIIDGEFQSNHAGGILAGISTGQDITLKVAFKPTSSLRLPAQSINEAGEAVTVVTKGRHDPCVGIRAAPIVEAMMALVLMDHCLRHQAQINSNQHNFEN